MPGSERCKPVSLFLRSYLNPANQLVSSWLPMARHCPGDSREQLAPQQRVLRSGSWSRLLEQQVEATGGSAQTDQGQTGPRPSVLHSRQATESRDKSKEQTTAGVPSCSAGRLCLNQKK